MGYPFDSLVPSYATTLGASADRPIALAELMGILVNGGVRKPTQRIDSLHFAKDTPYETLVKRSPDTKGEQVLNPEVARAVVNAIQGVAQVGTAKRVKQAFVKEDGSVVMVGGKTGTGDQRFDVFGAGHRLIESRYVNRSATFVFNIGERFFGTMTAYVHGPQSENYDFTSALPVQLLVNLAPSLMPMIEPTSTVTVPDAHATPTMMVAAEKAAAEKAAADKALGEKTASAAAAPEAAAAKSDATAKPAKPALDAAHPRAASGDSAEAEPKPHPKPEAAKPKQPAPAHAKPALDAAEPGQREAEPKPAPHKKPPAVEEVLQ
jgi:membrane peptidoglycan carboxypeptidase